jgi:hypothetical protein
MFHIKELLMLELCKRWNKEQCYLWLHILKLHRLMHMIILLARLYAHLIYMLILSICSSYLFVLMQCSQWNSNVYRFLEWIEVGVCESLHMLDGNWFNGTSLRSFSRAHTGAFCMVHLDNPFPVRCLKYASRNANSFSCVWMDLLWWDIAHRRLASESHHWGAFVWASS